MTKAGTYRSTSLAPLFILTTVVYMAAIVSRFGPVAAWLPGWTAWTMLLATFPLLFVAFCFESRIQYTEDETGPTWFRLGTLPIALTFTFAFTYITLVIFQTWKVSLGPFNPLSFPNMTLGKQIMQFGIATFGAFFINYMITSKLLIKLMNRFMQLYRNMNTGLAVVINAITGLLIGVVAVFALRSSALGMTLKSTQDFMQNNLYYILASTAAVILVPVILAALANRKSGEAS